MEIGIIYPKTSGALVQSLKISTSGSSTHCLQNIKGFLMRVSWNILYWFDKTSFLVFVISIKIFCLMNSLRAFHKRLICLVDFQECWTEPCWVHCCHTQFPFKGILQNSHPVSFLGNSSEIFNSTLWCQSISPLGTKWNFSSTFIQ